MSAEDMPQQTGKSVVIAKGQDKEVAATKDNAKKEPAIDLEAKLAARTTRKMNVIKKNAEFFVKNYEVRHDLKHDHMNITDLGEDQDQPKRLESSKRNMPELALNDVELAE